MARSDPKHCLAIRWGTSLIPPDMNTIPFNFQDQIKNGEMTAESESGIGKGEGRVNRSGYFFSTGASRESRNRSEFLRARTDPPGSPGSQRQKQDAFFIWRKPARQIWVSSFVLRYPRKEKENWKPKREE
ncbi:unnamed protein product [Bursaphelenchus xylophilus]|uniref:(pine wood nematode) hypothetical protein n=1 Tax=Bursaphelenchus xylophilus TaxID=6326 RepID=A0A1I7S368_BURXY|nr:unnamed protein product [Bursaphelenchus xylophilus]CAG9116114.1 unnamed protein product [Bursaphelenchus xylophilus]